MSVIRFDGTIVEFDDLNWSTGFQGFEQWINKQSPLRPEIEKFTIVNSLGAIIGVRWSIYSDLNVLDMRTTINR